MLLPRISSSFAWTVRAASPVPGLVAATFLRLPAGWFHSHFRVPHKRHAGWRMLSRCLSSTGASRTRLRSAPRSTLPSTCNDIRALQLDLVESTGLKLACTDTGRAVGWRARQGVGGPGGEGEDTIVGWEWDRGATDRSIRFWERSYKSRPMERVPPAAPATAAALPCSSPAGQPSRACKLMEPPAPAIASVCTPEVRNWSISPRAPETSIKEPDSRMRLPLFALNSTVPASSILPLRKPSALSLRSAPRCQPGVGRRFRAEAVGWLRNLRRRQRHPRPRPPRRDSQADAPCRRINGPEPSGFRARTV